MDDARRAEVLGPVMAAMNKLVENHGQRQGGLIGFREKKWMFMANILDSFAGLYMEFTENPGEEKRIIEAKIVPVLK